MMRQAPCTILVVQQTTAVRSFVTAICRDTGVNTCVCWEGAP